MTKRESTGKTDSKQQPKSNQASQIKGKQLRKHSEKKKRLFSLLRYQVGIPATLSLILPSLLSHKVKADDDIQNAEDQTTSKSDESSAELLEKQHEEPHQAEVAEAKESKNYPAEKADSIGARPSHHLVLHHYPLRTAVDHHLFHSPAAPNAQTDRFLSRFHGPETGSVTEHINPPHSPETVYYKPEIDNQQLSAKEDGGQVSGQLVATDNNIGEKLIFSTTAHVDGFTLQKDGSYTLDPDVASYQSLREGEVKTVIVPVTVTDQSGLAAKADLVITVTGTNDAPKISGQVAGQLKEDVNVDSNGLMSVSGQVLVQDIDSGESHTLAEMIQGQFGTLTIDAQGHWHYQVNNNLTAIQQLTAKSHLEEVLTIHTADNTPQQIQIIISGSDDRAVIAGVDQGKVIEDLDVHNGTLETSGTLSVTDVDLGQAHFIPQVVSGQYGVLAMGTDGKWSYEANNQQGAIQSLGQGVSLTDTITVSSADGTTHQIHVNIEGTNDRPVVSARTQLLNGVEDKPVIINASDLLTHASDIDSADTLLVTHLQATNGVVVDNHDGTYTFTPNKDYNGEVRLTYRVEDNHGAFVETQARFNLAASPDNAVITDVQTNVDLRGVTEDSGYIDTHYMLHYDGQLNIQDPDVGEAHFDPNIGSQTYQGIGYDTKLGGHVLLMPDGHYTYTLDNRNIQNLAEGEVRHDFATIRSVDGTTHTMEFTVHGTNDAPKIAAQSHSVTEGGSILSGQMQGQDIDTGATLTYSTPNVDGLVFHSDGSYTFNPGHPTYQSLAAGVTKTLSIPVTVTDEHQASSTSVLTIAVTGANNAAVVAGVDTGSVDEGAAGVNMSPDYAHSGMALLGRSTVGANGQLSITDVDSGEAKFDTHGFGYTYAGRYGDLSLTEDGKWFYYADLGHVRSVGGQYTQRGTQIDQLGEGQTLTDTVTVYTKDGTPHDIVITIHGDNDRPYCSSEVTLNAGAEDTRQTITVADLLANTTDVDANDAGKLTIENLHADHGSIQHNADGTFTFSPEKDYNGQVHFTYDVKDAHGGVTSTGASMILAAVNDNPDTQPITDSVTEDSTNHHVLDLLSGASDKEGDALSVQQLSFSVDGGPESTSLPDGLSLSPDGHTLVVDATHHAFQHLAVGHSQQVVMSYMVDDGHGGQTAQTATLSIQGSDDKATMVSHTIQLTESQALRSQFSTHHGNLQLTDPDTGDSTQFVFSGQYMGQGYAPGHLTVWPDGSYQFYLDSARNHHADDRIASLRSGETMEIPYQVETSDGQKLTIIVKVTGEDNQARIQVGPYSKFDNDAYEDKLAPGSTPNQVWSGGTLQVIDPDHDQAGFVAQRIDTPEGGHFSIDASGWWQYTIDNHKLQHLGAGQSYQKTFTVESIDGSAQRDITVTVHGRNDAPVVTSAVTIPAAKEDQTITLTVKQLLANATDVDDNDANQLTIDNLVADHGSITDNHDGTYTFTPDPDYNGQVQFTYDVKDAHGGSTTSGASLDLVAVNDASQLASGQDSANLTEDQVQSGTHQLATGWINLDVTDVDGATDADIAFIEVNGVKHAVPANFAMNLTANHGYFSTTHSTDGHNKWSYTADNDSPDIQGLKAGQQLQDSMVLITKDGTRIPVTATINGHDDHVIIDTPDKLTAAIGTAIEDTTTTVAGTLQAHDLDKGDQISFELATASQSQAGSYGTFYLDSTGHWRYDLDPAKADSLGSGEGKAEIFDIVAISSDGSRATQKVEVFVRGTNDAPVVSGSISLPSGEEDHSVTLHSRDLLANATDVDNYDRLSVTSLQADHGVVKDNHDGTYTFTPEPNYNGAVHFSYNVTDNHGASTPASASLTLVAVDDKTQFVGVNHGIAKEDIGTYDPLSNSSIKDSVNWQFLTITDIDSNNTQIQVEFAGKHYTWTLGQDLDVTTPYGKFQFYTIASGSHKGEHVWNYIGDNFNSEVQGLKAGESIHEAIKLTAQDGTEFPIQVEVRGTEDGVVIDTKSELAHVTEDSQTGASVSGQLVAHDTDVHDHVHWTESPSSGAKGSYGTFHVDAAGHWHYVVDQSQATQLGVGDEKWEYFNVEAVSSDGSRVTKRVAVVVHGQNDNPTVTADVTLTAGTEDTPIRLTSADLLANATHVDTNDRGWLKVANLSADHGTVTTNQDGSFTFTPSQDYNGVVRFSYDVIDRHGGSTSAHASVSLQAVNDAPELHVSPITPMTGTLTETDVDVGDSHQFGVSQSTGQYGVLSVDPDTGAYKYIPNGQIAGMHYSSVSGSYTGRDTFEVSVTDKAGLTSSLFITFDVTGTVAAPSGTSQQPVTSTLVSTQPTISQTKPTQMTTSAQATNHVTVDLTTSSDTGQSDTDNLTSAQTPEISGHTDIPFSLVKIYDGSKVIGSGYSDDHGNYQIMVVTLSDGVHSISARALAPASVLPAVSSVLPVTVDTQAPSPSISIDSITSDNVINAVESHSSIAITGSSMGGTQPGDVVTIELGGHRYTGQLDASGHYSIDVPGGELIHAAMIKASVSATDSAGNTATASADHHFDVDTSVSRPTITFEDPGPDNAYSKAEIAQGAAGTITATVHAAADAKVGEHININGVDHVLDAHSLQHGIQLEVAPSTIVRAVMTDEHGNVSSNLNMAAGAKPEPIVITAPSGSHQISASLGVPTLMPSQTPVPSAQQGWKILVNGHYHTSYTSQWGTLTIDPKTGHLSYQEHADVHTGPHGSAQNVGVHEDHFQIALQGSHQDDVLLHVQVSILSHGPGHSGKLTLGSEVLDMTVTPVTTNHPAPPPPPADFADEAMDVDDAFSESPLTIMTQLGLDASNEHHQPDEEQSQGVSSYLDKLGLENAPHSGAIPSSDALPDDIDIVFNDEITESSSVEYRRDGHEGGLHDDIVTSHEEDSRDDQHHHDDPTLPDDPNP
ncbi:VCBS domain-containing protein [Vibrio mediterranei]|uniref:VCBS domain-containing protein n=1 Tax=Vibrio mediterranei TaxID=689 RepID=UPI004069810B